MTDNAHPLPSINPSELTLTPLVGRVLRIEDVTWGDAARGYLARYRGMLYAEDTAAAYDQLADLLRPLHITPLFRPEDGRHVIYLMRGVSQPSPSKTSTSLLLLALTMFSVLFAGSLSEYTGPADIDLPALILDALQHIGRGLPFALSLMAILLAHEFGHYLVGRFHKTAVSLPYFIPFPLSSFGTMGAFIQMKEPPKNRRHLLDIGIAGPLAGLAVAIPVILLGLSLSTVHQLENPLPENIIFEGNSLLYLLLKYIATGELLPQPATYGDLSPLLYWVRYFFTGQPLPAGGWDVTLHPIAWAGWAGLLVTALNLIPAGQLDGGHLIYVLLGQRARKLLPFIVGGLVMLGIVWAGWWIWVVLILLMGRTYAEPLDTITTLDSRRKALAVLGLIIFVLVFTPVPLR